MAFSGPQADESAVDIRDDVGKWMELVNAAAIPVTTLEALKHCFGIQTIRTMQATLRTEEDLEDFMAGILFQAGGPLLHATGTVGWERDLLQGQFRVTP